MFVPFQFLLLNFSPGICSALQSVALLMKMLEILGERGQHSRDTEVPLICLACVCLPTAWQIKNCFNVEQIREKNVLFMPVILLKMIR